MAVHFARRATHRVTDNGTKLMNKESLRELTAWLVDSLKREPPRRLRRPFGLSQTVAA